ncbi:hypothetical protein [Symbiobacterium terraclitae]|uniref:hypothetical protein n=1 Tax=Symbiobacterium terraclitae TaxID=557451 RepID=UPI0035B511CE
MMYGPVPWSQRGRPRFPPQQAPVRQLNWFVQQTLPGTAVAHSYHVDAMRRPELSSDPAFQRFHEIELHELHHQIAAMGALQRLQMGDRRALEGLGYNLSRFAARRQSAMQTARQLSAAVQNDPNVQAMMNLVRQSNRMIRQYWPYIAQAIAAAGMGTVPEPRLDG